MLNKTTDGVNWEPVEKSHPISYVGGGSELGWGFDLKGDFYGVIRNEDGDSSGWGRRVVSAKNSALGEWKTDSSKSLPDIIESPRMFRFGDDLYLIGRTDPTGHFMNHEFWAAFVPSWLHHLLDLGWYSIRSHGNAMWKVNKDDLSLEKVADLPGCGDTSFASIVRVSKTKFMIANYSSPEKMCKNWWWIHGQLSGYGTSIYFLTIEFQ